MQLSNPIDQANMLRAFNKAAPHYERAALVQREVGNRLLERLQGIKLIPTTVVDLGCGTGYCTRQLALRYPSAKIIGIDLATAMTAVAAETSATNITYRCEDAQQTTIASHSVDLIFSNLLFQWCDTPRILAECKRMLAPNGLLLFTSLGPDTLYELRACWQKIDTAEHVNRFVDMHHLGDSLLKNQFTDPVMDSEYLSAMFNDIIELMYSLKMVGAQTVNTGRRPGLTGKQALRQLSEQYEAYRNADGLLPITYEVTYGQAWQADFRVQQTVDAAGNVRIPISKLTK